MEGSQNHEFDGRCRADCRIVSRTHSSAYQNEIHMKSASFLKKYFCFTKKYFFLTKILLFQLFCIENYFIFLK